MWQFCSTITKKIVLSQAGGYSLGFLQYDIKRVFELYYILKYCRCTSSGKGYHITFINFTQKQYTGIYSINKCSIQFALHSILYYFLKPTTLNNFCLIPEFFFFVSCCTLYSVFIANNANKQVNRKIM
jgi:hypothetical protein